MSSDAITVNAVLAAAGDWKELASRGTDGFAVSLLWSKATDRSPGHRRGCEVRRGVPPRRPGRIRARCLLPPVRVRVRPELLLRRCGARVPRSQPQKLAAERSAD